MAGALAGLRIVEVGEMVSAPYAAKLMADAGAEVIKVERPGIGDPARRRGPFAGDQPHPEKSGLFLYLNSNKLGVTLDIASARGFALLERMIRNADVLIHNLAPPEMDRIGLHFQRLSKANPKLIMTSILPFGLDGPYRDYRAANLTLWCAGGASYLNGSPQHPEKPPLSTFGQQAYYQGGAHAAVATMGALLAGLGDGAGQHVEVSVQEAVASILEMTFAFWPYVGMIASRLGQKPIQPLEVMKCKDGYIFICCIEEHQWHSFVELMGRPEWAAEEIFSDRLKRAAHWDALRPLLEEWVGGQSVHELYRQALERKIPFAPVSTMGDLLSAEHLKARGFFVELAHPQAGRYRYPGAPVKYSATPWEIRRPAPLLGQHNREVFVGQLELTETELAELDKSGVI
jgi:crotonobetainyl-CoA:carnitine CoA-transferase CaiB-like acyl-CoA transferase